MKINFAKKNLLLVLALLIIWVPVVYTAFFASAVKTPYYNTQAEAAAKMQECLKEIKQYKQEHGIPRHPEDINATGIIGEDFNAITTTLGYLPAKRTTANTDMAAYMIKVFNETGLKQGDRVAISASGSFPALIIATLAACDQMQLEPVIIISVGSSTYGANNPDFTAPEIIDYLADKKLLPNCIYGVTPGGDYDTGANMDETMLKEIENRLKEKGMTLHIEPDFESNIIWRRGIFESGQYPAVFVSIGGNVATTGTDEISDVGLVDNSSRTLQINAESGLSEIYTSEGIPVIRLIDIQKLVAQEGMAYDPVPLPEIGTADVYYEKSNNTIITVLSLLFCAVILIVFRGLKK